MIAEHQLAVNSRDSHVSSVVYADIGLARHDGTRIRANSSDSQRPLLDSAASIHGGGASLRPTSTRDTYNTQHANLSRASLLSTVSTVNNISNSSEDLETVPLNFGGPPNAGSSPLGTSIYGRSRASTTLSNVWPPLAEDGASGPSSRNNSNAGNGDISDAAIPSAEAPPSYDYGQHLQNQIGEEAPPYSSPVEPRSAQTWREEDVRAVDEQHEGGATQTTTGSGAPVLPTIERSATIRL
jgi:hypothetical protein